MDLLPAKKLLFIYLSKRCVLPNLTSSIPLTNVACNLPNRNTVFIYGYAHPLSNPYKQKLIYKGNTFSCTHHWFCYEKLMHNDYQERACEMLVTYRFFNCMKGIVCQTEWYDNEREIMLKILSHKVNEQKILDSLLTTDLDEAVYCDNYVG